MLEVTTGLYLTKCGKIAVITFADNAIACGLIDLDGKGPAGTWWKKSGYFYDEGDPSIFDLTVRLAPLPQNNNALELS